MTLLIRLLIWLLIRFDIYGFIQVYETIYLYCIKRQLTPFSRCFTLNQSEFPVFVAMQFAKLFLFAKFQKYIEDIPLCFCFFLTFF